MVMLNQTGPRFNIKMSPYQYNKCHCGDKMGVRSSYLHNGISYTSKMTSLYWFSPLLVIRETSMATRPYIYQQITKIFNKHKHTIVVKQYVSNETYTCRQDNVRSEFWITRTLEMCGIFERHNLRFQSAVEIITNMCYVYPLIFLIN